MLGEHVDDLREDLRMGSRRRAHADRGVVARRIRDLIRGVLAEHRNDVALIGRLDVVGDFLGLQRVRERLDLRRIEVVLTRRDDVHVQRSGIAVDGFGRKRARRVDPSAHRIVAVDDRHVEVGQRRGQLRGLGLDDFDVVGVFGDVVGRRLEADALFERDQTLLLEQQQRACFVRRVGRHADLIAFGRATAAAGKRDDRRARRGGNRRALDDLGNLHSSLSLSIRHPVRAPFAYRSKIMRTRL